MRLVLVALFALLFAGSGCVSNTSLYEWGDYESDMYKAYKNPEDEADFEKTLLVITERAKKKGTRVPPGIYAEIAYQRFEEDKLDDAIRYLEMEREAWPESQALMVRLVSAVQREQARREGGGEADPHLAWAVAPSEGMQEEAEEGSKEMQEAEARAAAQAQAEAAAREREGGAEGERARPGAKAGSGTAHETSSEGDDDE